MAESNHSDTDDGHHCEFVQWRGLPYPQFRLRPLVADSTHGTYQSYRPCIAANRLGFVVWTAELGRALVTLNRGASALQHVDKNEQTYPDHIHKVPVPAGRLEPKVIVRGEVAAVHPDQHYRKNSRAQGHVEAMETRQQEEG